MVALILVVLPFPVRVGNIESDQVEIGPMTVRQRRAMTADVETLKADVPEDEARSLAYAAHSIRSVGGTTLPGAVKGADLLDWPEPSVEVLTEHVAHLISEVDRFRRAHPVPGGGGVAGGQDAGVVAG